MTPIAGYLPKNEEPIKPHNFGHVHWCKFLVMEVSFESFVYKFLECVSSPLETVIDTGASWVLLSCRGVD